ncbi:unnamed protein product [Cuscuta europaea]|uniref:Uncharacterized protein n=1 Tax=Cuscuta europaea TaxID=41803 RepID=A0A9P0ZU15_CUSEU|nr:unnamed protein product [Cuscuta europaea]
MNCLFWNIRGLESSSSRLFSLIQQWRINLVAVIEPIVDSTKADSYKHKHGLNAVLFSPNTKIWNIWDPNSLIILDTVWHTQFVPIKVKKEDFSWWITFIYGNHCYISRRYL